MRAKAGCRIFRHQPQLQNTCREWAKQYGFPGKNILSYNDMARLADARDIATVHVVTPNSLHAEHSIAAAEAGKHVMCEKPMATSSEQCEAMIAAAKSSNVRLGVNYRLHWEPHHVKAMELLASGAVGDLSIGNYEYSWGYAGSLSNPQSAKTIKKWLLDPKMAGGGAMFDDGFQALCRASYSDSFHQCTTLGPKGTVEILSGLEGGSVYDQSAGGKANPKRVLVNRQEVPADETLQLGVLLDEFAKSITAGTAFKCPGEMGLRDIRIVEAIYPSARHGGTSVAKT